MHILPPTREGSRHRVQYKILDEKVSGVINVFESLSGTSNFILRECLKLFEDGA